MGRTKVRYSKEILLDVLIKYAAEHGVPPTRRELNSTPELPSDMTYRRIFGSWGKALLEAGFEVPSPYPSEQCLIATADAHRGRVGFNNKGGRIIGRDGYVYIWNTDKQKYEREHRVVMSKHIGREFTDDEDVHHINFNKSDNRIENLMLLSKREHSLLHNKFGHHNHTKPTFPCEYPNCTNTASGTIHLCRQHYKSQWFRMKKGLISDIMEFKEIPRKHSEETRARLSELAKQLPRKGGKFCPIHDNPELLNEK